MLIVSVPQVHQQDLLKEIISCPGVDAVRYNTGMRSAYSPDETVKRLKLACDKASMPLYLDLKGKQLRVVRWANLPDGPIILNHNIKTKLPAKVYFRGDERPCNLIEVVNGNEIFVDPLPSQPVGEGQAVNIISNSLEIEGSLLPVDYKFVEAGVKYGVTRFMLSFVESLDDGLELKKAIRDCLPASKKSLKDFEIRLKIESEAGVKFVQEVNDFELTPYRLEAARDDLMIHIGVTNMLKALKEIIKKDPQAICASRLLMGLKEGEVSMADVSDLELMYRLGYKGFMLSDTISRLHFRQAVEFYTKWSRVPLSEFLSI